MPKGAEFQGRQKQTNEDWAALGEDLKTLVERAYPALQAERQELLALNQFLARIEDPQLAFGVRRKTPTTVDAAVAATLELETYMKSKIAALPIAQIDQSNNEDADVHDRCGQTLQDGWGSGYSQSVAGGDGQID